jgi:hypothetical protein
MTSSEVVGILVVVFMLALPFVVTLGLTYLLVEC